jgi:hypothetical protein|tara:strand:- start:170 stop:328 length:159 start_codon:yes stop_codon:yes gene_type:complete
MSDEYQELELLVQIAMASGEEYYLDGDKTTDYKAVAKALLDGTHHVYSIRKN